MYLKEGHTYAITFDDNQQRQDSESDAGGRT